MANQSKGESNSDELYSGRRMLEKTYSFVENLYYSPQMSMVTEGSLTGFIFGFLVGGVKESRDAYINFMENNKLTAFDNHVQAKRQLQDQVTLALCRGGWKVGWRFGLISASILGILSSLHAYRGHTSIFDFSLASAASMGIYKFKHGPKPALAGCIIGAGLGVIPGAVVVGVMKLTGVTFDDIFLDNADKINKLVEEKAQEFEEYRENEDIFYRKLGNDQKIDNTVITENIVEAENENDMVKSDKLLSQTETENGAKTDLPKEKT